MDEIRFEFHFFRVNSYYTEKKACFCRLDVRHLAAFSSIIRIRSLLMQKGELVMYAKSAQSTENCFNAPYIDRLAGAYHNKLMNPETPSQALMNALNPLFDVLAPLASCKKNDEAKILWLVVPRGEIEDWMSFEDAKEYDEIQTYEEYENLWKEYYPDEQKWYRLLISENHPGDRFKHRSVLLDNIVLVNADLNDGIRDETWNKEELGIELLPLLTGAAKRSMDMLKCGTYNDYVEAALPYWHRTGVLCCSDYWKVCPESRDFVWENMDEQTYQLFLSYLPSNKEENIGRLSSFTADDFFNACFLGYQACGYELNGMSYSEAYLKYADGRDEWLTGTGCGLNAGPGIDFDDPKAWDEWYNGSHGGGHPWEIIRGGNSTHVDLYVMHDNDHLNFLLRSNQICQEEYEKRKKCAGYYFMVAGKYRAWEAVRFFVALRKAGLPVILNDADEIRARYDGKSYIGVVPHRSSTRYCEDLFPAKYGHVIDAIQIFQEDEDLLPYVEWLPEEKAKLLSA